MRSVLGLSALVAAVSAQTQNLTAALTGATDLSSLAAALSAYPQLVSTLGSATNITILAPNNAAFSKLQNSTGGNTTLANSQLVQAILSYHVLNGTYNSSQVTSNATFIPTSLTSPLLANVTGGQRVEAINSSGTVQFFSGLLQASNVTQANIAFTGGVIHVIDTILTPPANISTTAINLNLSAAAGALTRASLVETIDTTRDLTVFVPNNQAFSAVASALNNASIETLTEVLGYHVVAGSVIYSSAITANTTIQALSGGDLNVTLGSGGAIYVNQARVVLPNVLVANGVVHVIDSVLNPNATGDLPGTNGTNFPGASSASDIPFTSGVPTPSTTISVPAQATSTRSTGGAAHLGVQAYATGVVGAGALFAGAFLGM